MFQPGSTSARAQEGLSSAGGWFQVRDFAHSRCLHLTGNPTSSSSCNPPVNAHKPRVGGRGFTKTRRKSMAWLKQSLHLEHNETRMALRGIYRKCKVCTGRVSWSPRLCLRTPAAWSSSAKTAPQEYNPSYGKFDPISYFIYKITLQSQALMMMSQSTLEPSYKARVLECLRRSFQLDALPCLQVWGLQ